MLEVEAVHAAYGGTPALSGVTLHAGSGEVVGILGRNGVGKTTLLKTLVGLVPCSQGRIVLEGHEITRFPPHARARMGIGYVPQGREIFAGLTVEENLRMGARLHPRGRPVLLQEVLAYFPILRERKSQKGETLSGGQQQMLAIGRALVGGPRLLLLDEPSEGLQPTILEEICEKIDQINRQLAVTVLLVEQNLEFAARLARRVYIMEKGRVVKEVPQDQILNEEIVREHLSV